MAIRGSHEGPVRQDLHAGIGAVHGAVIVLQPDPVPPLAAGHNVLNAAYLVPARSVTEFTELAQRLGVTSAAASEPSWPQTLSGRPVADFLGSLTA